MQLHNGIFISDVCSSIPLDLIIRWARVDNHMSAGGAVSGTKNSLKMLRLILYQLLDFKEFFRGAFIRPSLHKKIL